MQIKNNVMKINQNRFFLTIQRLGLAFLTLALVSCATIPEGQVRIKKDPWEETNRTVLSFNDNLDDYIIRPVTKVYEYVLPSVVRTAIRNVFSNIGDVYNSVNNLLQGKPKAALDDLVRVVVNTTIGLGGIWDAASAAGVEKHSEDFGQTFGVWGIPDGPYMVLPLLGPSTVRDTVGWFFDIQTDILIKQIDNIPLRNSTTGLRIIDQRAKYLGSSDLLESAALDKYSFIRDAYLQRRRSKLYDGNPPMMEEEDEENTPDYSTENKRIR
jgi:phospholipid-binding lipoprotein MlaA